jgi:hypothetical protein
MRTLSATLLRGGGEMIVSADMDPLAGRDDVDRLVTIPLRYLRRIRYRAPCLCLNYALEMNT